MDVRKYQGEHFVKVDDVRNGPIEGEIAVVKDGRYDKLNVVLESGDVVSLNATNLKALVRAYVGTIAYQGADHDAVLVKPISPPIRKAKKPAPAPSQKTLREELDDDLPEGL